MKDNPKLEVKFTLYIVFWNLVSGKKMSTSSMKWYSPGISAQLFLRSQSILRIFTAFRNESPIVFQIASHCLIIN